MAKVSTFSPQNETHQNLDLLTSKFPYSTTIQSISQVIKRISLFPSSKQKSLRFSKEIRTTLLSETNSIQSNKNTDTSKMRNSCKITITTIDMIKTLFPLTPCGKRSKTYGFC